MNKTILISAAFLGLLSVVFGAFGAHGLKDIISNESIQTFETGVRYQMYHAILLLFIGSSSYVSVKNKKVCYYLILTGVLFFSGSVYGLATNTLTNFDFKTIAFITPLGGFLLILSWLVLCVGFLKLKADKL